ncbi:hypothetical protein FQZ97_1062590 [compost metagenome]
MERVMRRWGIFMAWGPTEMLKKRTVVLKSIVDTPTTERNRVSPENLGIGHVLPVGAEQLCYTLAPCSTHAHP